LSRSELPKPGLLRRDASRASQRGTLSPELDAAAARRLGAVALVTAGAGLLLGGLEPLLLPSPTGNPRLRLASAAVSVALSLGLFGLIRANRLPPGSVRAVALAYQVAQGLVTSIGFYAFALAPGVPVRGWTSVAVWIVVFPLFVPAPPARVALATLLTALTDPLGLWINVRLGAPAPSLDALVPLFVPTVVACLISPLAARIVYGLTVEVKRVREMGSYRLVEKLGQGGMGEVWRAEHRMLARGAAIKLIRSTALGAGDGSRAREMVKRFEREAQATAALRSPHTIEVYD
jgi:serine/threonine-protein kinase